MKFDRMHIAFLVSLECICPFLQMWTKRLKVWIGVPLFNLCMSGFNSSNYFQWVLSWLWSNLIFLSPAKHLWMTTFMESSTWDIFLVTCAPLCRPWVLAVEGNQENNDWQARASLPNFWSKRIVLLFPFFQGESKWQTKLPFTIVWKLKLIDFDIYNPSLETHPLTKAW